MNLSNNCESFQHVLISGSQFIPIALRIHEHLEKVSAGDQQVVVKEGVTNSCYI